MKIHFVTYANARYKERQRRLIKDGSKCFEHIHAYDDSWLKSQTEFYERNRHILEQQRGAGYWLWKPFVIRETMDKAAENDAIFYLDSGDIFRRGIASAIKTGLIGRDQMFTTSPFAHACYTKGDCFYLMGCSAEYYYQSPHIEAGILVFKNSSLSRKVVDEWLDYCRNENILTDKPNEFQENLPEFLDHRHDQSVLANLTAKYRLYHSSLMRQYVTCNYGE